MPPNRRRLLVLPLLVSIPTLCHCGPPWELEEKGIQQSGIINRIYGPAPESYWNKLKIWYHVGDEPPTYLPVGYPARAPRTQSAGTWVVDRRDGKRLFVPNEGVERFSRSVLMAEAESITQWED